MKQALAVKRAVAYVGSARKLAKKIGVSHTIVSSWANLDRSIPYEKAIHICILTSGEVTIEELRPDLIHLTKKFKQQYLDQCRLYQKTKQLTIELDMPVVDIKRSYCSRNEFGDIEAFAHLIHEQKLMQPILVNTQLELVLGERRLKAIEYLGWQRVPICFCDIDDEVAVYQAKLIDNLQHKCYTAKEHLQLYQSIANKNVPKATVICSLDELVAQHCQCLTLAVNELLQNNSEALQQMLCEQQSLSIDINK